jgi:hypothetical protein
MRLPLPVTFQLGGDLKQAFSVVGVYFPSELENPSEIAIAFGTWALRQDLISSSSQCGGEVLPVIFKLITFCRVAHEGIQNSPCRG